MNKIKYILYIMLMVFSIGVYASPPMATKHLSDAMFVFITSVLMFFVFSYIMWKLREKKRRESIHKTVNRGPVKKPMIAYRKKRISKF